MNILFNLNTGITLKDLALYLTRNNENLSRLTLDDFALLESHIDFNSKDDQLLDILATHLNADIAKEILLTAKYKASASCSQKAKDFALIVILIEDITQRDLIKHYLAIGADPNGIYKLKNHQYATHIAYEHDARDIMILLIAYGANLYQNDAFDHNVSEYFRTLLLKSPLPDDLDFSKINAADLQNRFEKSIYHALENKHFDVIEFYINELKPKLLSENKKKKSKSDAASRTGKIRLLKKISVETIRLSASV